MNAGAADLAQAHARTRKQNKKSTAKPWTMW